MLHIVIGGDNDFRDIRLDLWSKTIPSTASDHTYFVNILLDILLSELLEVVVTQPMSNSIFD